jgi:hypothetical protein
LKENKNINQSSFEEEDDLDLQEGDPNTFLQDDVMIKVQVIQSSRVLLNV